MVVERIRRAIECKSTNQDQRGVRAASDWILRHKRAGRRSLQYQLQLHGTEERWSARMKIVHILQGKAKPDSLSGVNKIVHWMATSQVRLGHDVEVWGLAVSMTLPPHPREYDLRLFPMTTLRVTLSPEIKAAKIGRASC